MRRREFIALLSSVTALPLAAGAQQHEQMRRVAVLLGGLEFGDASGQTEIAAFEEGLKKLGWNFPAKILTSIITGRALRSPGCAPSQTRSSLHIPILYSAARRQLRPR